MPTIDAEFLRQRYPQLKDASDTEIASLAQRAFAPDMEQREFENRFLGKASAMQELGRGLVRGVRGIKAGWDFAAGGMAGAFGADDDRDEIFQSYDKNVAESNKIAARRRFTDIESAGDALDWAAGVGGEVAPMLASGAAGPRAVLATATAGAIPQAQQRVEQLIPNASTGEKTAAFAGMTALNAVGDSLIPARVASGVAGQGVRGIARDVAQAGAVNAAIPLGERALAGAVTGDGDAISRGGYAQVGTEVIEGAAGGALGAAAARPVIRGTQALADRLPFNRFSRTETGEVDLTQQVSDAQRDRTPALTRRGGEVQWGPANLPPVGETADMFGGAGTLLDGRPLGAPVDEPPTRNRRQLELDFAGERPTMYAAEDGAASPDQGALASALLARDQLGVNLDKQAAEAAMARAEPGQVLDMFGGPPSYPNGAQVITPEADTTPVRNRRQTELPFDGREPIVVTDDGEAIPGGIRNAFSTIDSRLRAQEMQREAQMAEAKPGQTLDMFTGRGRFPPAPEATMPVAPAVDVTPQRELPGMVTKGALLRELQSASSDTKIPAFRGGEALGGKSPTGLRAILDAQDPVAAMREAYADGAHPKAELIDKWHERLVGRKISEPEAAVTPTEPARAPEAGERFAATEDLQTRGLKGMAKLRDALKRAPDEETSWNIKEDIKEFTRALKTTDPAQRRRAVDSLEKRVLQLDNYLGTPSPGEKFSAGYLRRPASDNVAPSNVTGGGDVRNSTASSDVPARRGPRPEVGGRAAGDSVRVAQDVADVGALRRALERDSSESLPSYAVRTARLRDAKDLSRLGEVFGHRVVGFDTDGRKSLASVEGVTRIPGADGAIFVNAKATHPGRLVFGHELVHQIRENAPDLYTRLVDAMEASTDAGQAAKYAERLKKDYADADIGEEMVGNVVGHLFATDKAFVRQFGRKSPEFIRPLLDFVQSTIDRIKEGLGLSGKRYEDPRMQSLVRDLENLTAEVSATLKQYEKRGDQTDSVGAKFMRKAQEDASLGKPDGLRAVASKGFEQDIKNQIADGLSSGKQGAFERALGLMTTEQIVEQFGKTTRGAKDLAEALSKKFGAPFDMAARADVTVKKMLGLPEVTRRNLADIMFAATEAEIHPDKPLADSRTEPTQGDADAHALLARKYDALPKEAKEAYQEARKLMDKQFVDIVSSLRRLVSRVEPDPSARAARLQQIDDMVGRTKGPYFPLARFGDFVLIAKNAAADGRSIVQHFETKAAMERARAEMVDMGVNAEKIVMTRRDDPRYGREVSAPFVESVRQAIDTNVDDPDQRAALSQALNELVLRSLPAASGAKNFIRRRNVQGYSNDAARALADSVTRAERYVANLNFTPDVNAALTDLRQFHAANQEQMPIYALVSKDKAGNSVVALHASASERLRAQDALLDKDATTTTVRAPVAELAERLAGVAPDLSPEQLQGLTDQALKLRSASLAGNDVTQAQAVANHLIEKTSAMTQPRMDSKTLRAMGQVAHVAFLGLSPMYWATNLAQVPTLTFSQLSGKYGQGAAAKEIGRATKAASHAFKLMVDHLGSGRGAGLDLDGLKGVSPDERAALRYLADRGMLDITQNADLVAVAEGDSPRKRAALEYITAGAHYTELFNRMVTGLASYRLAKTEHGEQRAMQMALDDVTRTQFNYADWNKPRYFQTTGPLGQMARPLLMFQQYAQNTLYWWGANIKRAYKNAEPGDRRDAARAMLTHGAALTFLGGVAGLPLAGTVHLLANMAGQMMSDDPGYDAERELEEALAEMGASQATTKALTRGVFTLGGVDLSERIGQGDLIPGLTKRSRERMELALDPTTAWVASFFGPVGSLLGNFAGAVGSIQEGDYTKALEAFPVKGAADLARAYNMASRGVTSRDGLVTMDPNDLTAADVVMRAAGATPLSVSEAQDASREARVVEERLNNRKSSLTKAIVRAAMAGDEAGLSEGLEAVLKFNTTVAARYPQAVIETKALDQAVNDAMKKQLMLQVTGGRARDQRAMMLMLQLNPGLNMENLRPSTGSLSQFSGGPDQPEN